MLFRSLDADRRLDEVGRELEARQASIASLEAGLERARRDDAPPPGKLRRLLYYLGREGFVATARRAGAHFRMKQ